MTTPEPDFDQRARILVDAFLLDPDVWGTHGEPSGTKLTIITTAIAEQLRQAWNARGAADRAALGVEFKRAMGAGGGEIRPEEILKALDS